MKLCFPVTQNIGLDSEVFNHFGSAPLFVVVDSESRVITPVDNGDLGHHHGACNPVKALGNTQVDAIAVRGIGQGAITRLNQMGLKVYKAETTITTTLEKLHSSGLTEWPIDAVCQGHSHGHDHDHGHHCSHS